MRLSGPSSSWRLLLLLALVVSLLLIGYATSYCQDQTELLSELQMISNDLSTAQSYIDQGLLKVENSLTEQERAYQRLDERLKLVEQQLQKASQELMTSEQDSLTLTQQISDLQDSFDDYKVKQERKSKLLKLGLGAALVVILAEGVVIALK